MGFPDPPFTLTAWGCGCNVVEGEVVYACRKRKKCLRLHPTDYVAEMLRMHSKLVVGKHSAASPA